MGCHIGISTRSTRRPGWLMSHAYAGNMQMIRCIGALVGGFLMGPHRHKVLVQRRHILWTRDERARALSMEMQLLSVLVGLRSGDVHVQAEEGGP
jgi:hypothetical protein